MELRLSPTRFIWELFAELVEVGVLDANDPLRKVLKDLKRTKMSADRKEQISGYLSDRELLDLDQTTAGMLANAWIKRLDGTTFHLIHWNVIPPESTEEK